MNLEIFEVHGGPNYGLLDSPSSTFHINLFFHTSLNFAKEQLAYHILILIGCIILSRIEKFLSKIIHCAVGVLTQSSVQIHNEKLTKICIWLTPRNWVVWDWQTFSVCVRAVHTVSFLWISCPVLDEFLAKNFHYSFLFFLKTPLVMIKSILRNLL